MSRCWPFGFQVLNKEDLEGQFSKLVEGLSDAASTSDMVAGLQKYLHFVTFLKDNKKRFFFRIKCF